MNRLLERSLPFVACCAIACVPAATPDVGSTEQAVESSNGVSLNGVSLNGVSLNGVSLNGVSLNGVSLNGVSLNGVGLNGVSLNGVSLNGVSLNGIGIDGSALAVVTTDGTVIEGDALVGSVLTVTTEEGASIDLRIDGATLSSEGLGDLWQYRLSYRSAAGWSSVCGSDAQGQAVSALFVSGAWDMAHVGQPQGGSRIHDETLMTIACRPSSVGKCVALGYEPWRDGRICVGDACAPVSLDEYLSACVRLLRADYCGDGRSWTTNGREVDLWDHAGVQSDTDPTWTFEAEWDQDGARCVSTTRVVEAATPDCLDRLEQLPSCGASSTVGRHTLLWDRFETQLSL